MFNRSLLVGTFLLILSGCGVKGDPLPPLMPTEIGRGRPTYKRAMRKVVDPSILNEEDADEENSKNKFNNEKKGY